MTEAGRRGAIVMLAASGAVLVATGVPLIWRYTPAGSTLQDVHQVSAWSFLGSAIAVLAVHLSQRRWVPGTAVVVVAAAGIVTGWMIAWDWLAVWAVTIGEDNRGVLDAMSGNQVRFVFVDNHQLTPELYRLGVVAHVIVIPLLAAAGTAFLRPTR